MQVTHLVTVALLHGDWHLDVCEREEAVVFLLYISAKDVLGKLKRWHIDKRTDLSWPVFLFLSTVTDRRYSKNQKILK